MPNAQARTRISQAFKDAVVDFECTSHLIHRGPGELRSILIGNAGCCAFVIYDGKRPIWRMQPAFAGSFYMGIGFVEELRIDMFGEMPCHLHLSYRPAPARLLKRAA